MTTYIFHSLYLLASAFCFANKDMLFSPYWPLFNVDSEIYKVDQWTNEESFDDTKWVFRSRMSIDKQYKGQKKTDKRQSNLPKKNYTVKKNQIPTKTGGELKWSGRVSSSCSFTCIRHVTVVLDTSICK